MVLVTEKMTGVTEKKNTPEEKGGNRDICIYEISDHRFQTVGSYNDS